MRGAEVICRNFIWGSSETQRKWYLISWEKICKPKDQGGMGFRNLRILNKAYMAKLAWQISNNQDKLWVQIMRYKYSCGSFGTPSIFAKPYSYNVWKAIY